ncbi:hypothetical protein [Halpernia frigidisoli]|uniref:Uncharacterized protein n=1 Tax=Halpernia frigidisoli TaxID=1125876 RepID=A0A1I3EGV8_9FLAO|nr:hypothetical protein [Halpernia frigidisoli]SFH98090.1 hypothetical protein SAMN05443292_1069 [Halpernia frigidisoli]
MAGLVLNSSSVFQLNFSAKLKFSASISATSPSRKTLYAILNAITNMNDYYKQPKLLQWIEAILFLLVGIVGGIVIIEKGYSQPAFYLFFLIYVPISQFAFTPFFRLVSIYRYYSPMLLGYMPNDIQIDLHSGGSFDYLFVMRKFNVGVEIRNKLLMYHLEGIVYLIKQIENKSIPDTVELVGTSYFFNNRTLHKMGFEISNPSLFYRLNLFVNFIDLIWMYSISRGKFSIPKLWKAKKASITGIKLIESKKQIEELYEKLKTKSIA